MIKLAGFWARVAVAFALAAGPAMAQEEPSAAAPPGPDDPADSGAQAAQAITKLFEIIRQEPTAREVQAWALAFYKLDAPRIHQMARAARLKGLVPEFETSLDNSLGNAFTNTRDGRYPMLPNPATNPNPESYMERVANANSQLTWRIRTVWNLDRLVFNAEALDVKSLNSLGESLVREVTTLYFNRRRALASLILSTPTNDEELFYELMRLDELTATLDALTGGKFAKRAWSWEESSQPATDTKPKQGRAITKP
jgi:hypothetical protein